MSNSNRVNFIITATNNASAKIRQVRGDLQGMVDKGKFTKTELGLATAAIGAGFLKMAKASLDSSISFQSAFAGIRKTVDTTEKGYEKLRKGTLNLARTMPVSPEQLARIGELGGQLGVAEKDITKFQSVIAKVAVTTNLTEEAASTAFARISNVMQEPIDNIDRMASATVQLGNRFATTEAEIVEFAQRIASSGSIAKLTTSDILGIGTALSSVGINAEAGGTAVQKVLNKMTESVSTGSDELKTFAATAGLSAKEFAKVFRTDASEAFTLFVEGLGTSGDKAFGILDNLEVGNERVINSFLSLSNAGDILREAIDQSNMAFEQNIALNEEAEKRFATVASQLTMLGNNIRITFMSVTDLALKPLSFALGIVNKGFVLLANLFQMLDPRVQLIIQSMAAMTVVVAGVTTAILVLKTSLISGFVSAAIASIGAIASVVIAFAPLILTIGAVAAAVYGLYRLWEVNFFGIRDIASSVFSFVKDSVNNFIQTIQTIWSVGTMLIKVLWSQLMQFVPDSLRIMTGAATTVLSPWIKFAKEMFMGFAKYVGVIFSGIGGVIVGTLGFIVGIFTGAGKEQLENSAKTAFKGVANVAVGAGNMIVGAFENALNLVVGALNSLREKANEVLSFFGLPLIPEIGNIKIGRLPAFEIESNVGSFIADGFANAAASAKEAFNSAKSQISGLADFGGGGGSGGGSGGSTGKTTDQIIQENVRNALSERSTLRSERDQIIGQISKIDSAIDGGVSGSERTKLLEKRAQLTKDKSGIDNNISRIEGRLQRANSDAAIDARKSLAKDARKDDLKDSDSFIDDLINTSSEKKKKQAEADKFKQSIVSGIFPNSSSKNFSASERDKFLDGIGVESIISRDSTTGDLSAQVTSPDGITIDISNNNFYGDDREFAEKISNQIYDIFRRHTPVEAF